MTAKLTGNYAHLVPDHVMARALTAKPELHCYCCGTVYRRGQFRCCAPPKGMKAHKWLELSCWEEGGCGKCARHCQCPSKAERLGPGPMRMLAEDFLASVRQPVAVEREPGEEGRASWLLVYLMLVVMLVFLAGLDLAFVICRAFLEAR